MWDKSLKADCEGPFGIPMKDAQAQAVEAIMKDLPKEEPYVHTRTKAAQTPATATVEVDVVERYDVSWITTENKDHQGDIVLAKGCDQSVYGLNRIVTRNHDYKLPAVAKNVWIKYAKSGELKGLKGKTEYPARPAEWHESVPWEPSQVLCLVDLRLLPGKSIGFLPISARRPTPEEIKANKDLYGNCRYIIEKWLLLEYSIETMPCNAPSLVEASKKGLITDDILELVGVEIPKEEEPPPPEAVIANVPIEPEVPIGDFVTQEQYAKAIREAIERFDFSGYAHNYVHNQVNRFMGRP